MTPVLMVEADTAIRNFLHLLLKDRGYTVLEAADGAAALAVLRAHREPLVVLVDLAMPGTSGEVLLRTVRAEPALCRHVYVVITARLTSTFTPDQRDLFDAVCLEIVEKPFNMSRLEEVVRRAQEWVLPVYHYASLDALIAALSEQVVAPAEAKAREVRRLRPAEQAVEE